MEGKTYLRDSRSVSLRVRVTCRSIVKASVTRPGAVLPVSNLDLLYYP